MNLVNSCCGNTICRGFRNNFATLVMTTRPRTRKLWWPLIFILLDFFHAFEGMGWTSMGRVVVCSNCDVIWLMRLGWRRLLGRDIAMHAVGGVQKRGKPRYGKTLRLGKHEWFSMGYKNRWRQFSKCSAPFFFTCYSAEHSFKSPYGADSARCFLSCRWHELYLKTWKKFSDNTRPSISINNFYPDIWVLQFSVPVFSCCPTAREQLTDGSYYVDMVEVL